MFVHSINGYYQDRAFKCSCLIFLEDPGSYTIIIFFMHHQKIIVFRYHLYIFLLVLIRGIQKYWSRFSMIYRFKVIHILSFLFRYRYFLVPNTYRNGQY